MGKCVTRKAAWNHVGLYPYKFSNDFRHSLEWRPFWVAFPVNRKDIKPTFSDSFDCSCGLSKLGLHVSIVFMTCHVDRVTHSCSHQTVFPSCLLHICQRLQTRSSNPLLSCPRFYLENSFETRVSCQNVSEEFSRPLVQFNS